MDDDVWLRAPPRHRDQKWRPFNYGNLAYNAIAGAAVRVRHRDPAPRVGPGRGRPRRPRVHEEERQEVGRKIAKQTLKDYVVYPALTGKAWKSTLTANLTAGVIRNLWTNAVIFCGHFPDGAEKFTKADVDNETHAEWYLRQMLGSANISGGRVMDFMTGNLRLSDRTPHLPGSAVQSVRGDRGQGAGAVREVRPAVHHGPLPVQYAKSWRTIAKLSLPNKFLKDTPDDAPERRRSASSAATPPRRSTR